MKGVSEAPPTNGIVRRDGNIPLRHERMPLRNNSTMPRGSFSLLLFVLSSLVCASNAYRPVIVMHGVFSSYRDMDSLVGMIAKARPGINITNVKAYDDLESLDAMWKQVDGVYTIMKPVMDDAKDGVILICYSQGGLVCRGVLEKYGHNVHTLISLSSPLAGQFGDTEYINAVFPGCVRDDVYEVAYSSLGQDISIANYWNDPHHQDLYYKYCNFLPSLNNGSGEGFKTNFQSLQQLVLIGGPDDGVITPWQSSHFGFYDQNLTVIEMEDQKYYVEDSFGLQALTRAGKVETYKVPGVQHLHWHTNQTVFDSCIEPWLT